MIECSLCGKQVRQVSSATPALALWQHQNWVCKGDTVNNIKLPILFCTYGLPRSGKTTLVKDLVVDFPVVNQDNIRLALHGQRYAAKAEPFVHAITKVMVEALFRAGHQVVVLDETCYSRAKRDSLKSSMWQTWFYEVPTSPDVCKQRALNTEQPDLIPVIDQMWNRREPLGTDENVVTNSAAFLDEVYGMIFDAHTYDSPLKWEDVDEFIASAD